jgi:hypothetical protein
MGTGYYIFMAVMGCLMVVAACYENAEKEKRKQRVQAAKQWNGVSIGLSKPVVWSILGEPHKVVQLGEQEMWGFGPTDRDGTILFIAGKVAGYNKPAILSPMADDSESSTPLSSCPGQTDLSETPTTTQQERSQESSLAAIIIIAIVAALMFVIFLLSSE